MTRILLAAALATLAIVTSFALVAIINPHLAHAAAPSGDYTHHSNQHYFESNVNIDGTVTQAGSATYTSGLTVTGGTVNLNASSNNAVNVGTGTTTSTVTIGGAGTQSIAVGDGAGIKTVALGSATSTSSTAINSGTGDLTITSTDDLTINGGSAGSILTLGGNTEGNTINVGADDTTADTITVGSAKDTSALAGIAVTVGSTGTTSALTLQSGTGNVTITSTAGINIGANAVAQDIDLGNATGASSLDLFAGTGNISVSGSFDSDFVWATGIAGGADLSVAAGAADTAGSSFDLTGAAGGAAGVDQVGQNGGVVSLTGGAGSAKNGAGATDGNGADLVLLGGARGGATGGTEVHGIVRVGSPTVGSTKATDVLAVGGAFEVDGIARFDGTVAFNSTTTLQAGDIIAADILDLTRSVPLPLFAWFDCTTPAALAFTSGANTLPDIAMGTATPGILYDDTGGEIDVGEICTSFTVPADYASGGSFVARVSQDAATAGQLETFSCRISVDGAAVGADNAGTNVDQTAVQSVTSTPAGTWAAGASIGVSCKQGNGSADDAVTIWSIEGRYTATQ